MSLIVEWREDVSPRTWNWGKMKMPKREKLSVHLEEAFPRTGMASAMSLSSPVSANSKWTHEVR